MPERNLENDPWEAVVGRGITPLMKYSSLSETLWWELPETEISISQTQVRSSAPSSSARGLTHPADTDKVQEHTSYCLLLLNCWLYSLNWTREYSLSVCTTLGQEEAK